MVLVSMIVGMFLMALGFGVFLFHPEHPFTSLIPAAFGALFVLLGYFARNPAWRMHIMHAAALLALVGLLSTFGGIVGVIRLIAGQELRRPDAAIAQAVMAGACLVFLILAVRSFINARRNPQAGI
jgi:hypothetical protein